VTSEKIDTTGWSAEDVQALQNAQEVLEREETKLAAHKAAEEAYKASPAFMLQQIRERAEAARVEREEAERAKLGAEELAKAQAVHGKDKVALIPTLRGPIVLRAPTDKEAVAQDLRVDALPNPQDRPAAWRDYTAGLVVFPSREAFQAIMAEFPGSWPIVAEVRDSLSIAMRAETAKKG
jgi:hypothetical protein